MHAVHVHLEAARHREMWRFVCDHFAKNRVLFLTATKTHHKGYILGSAIGEPDDKNPPVYERSIEWAVAKGYIRGATFHEFGDPGTEEANGAEDGESEVETLVRLTRAALDDHDLQHPDVVHKAMILSHRVAHANVVTEAFNLLGAGECATYTSNTPNKEALLERFKANDMSPRVLSVCGSLLEGFDHKPVSVLGIYRNVGRERKVLFTQWIGRVIRKLPGEPNDLAAKVIVHCDRDQRASFEELLVVAE